MVKNYTLSNAVILLCFFTFFTHFLLAQELDSTLFLKEVGIKDSRIFESASFKVQNIDSLSLSNFKTDNLATLLATKSPIFIKFYGVSGLATPSFRGTSAGHTQVYWNGILLNSPTLGQIDFSLFPVAISDEVTILYGAASLAEGVGGFGGAIQLNSKINQNSTSNLTFSQSLASFKTYKTNLGFQLGNKKFKSSSKFFYKSAENKFPYIYKHKKAKQINAELVQYGFLQEFHSFLNPKHQLSGRIWYQKSQREIPPSVLVNKNEENQDDNSLKMMLEWQGKSKLTQFKIAAAYIDNFLAYQNIPAQINSKSKVKSLQFNSSFYRIINEKILLEYGYRFLHDRAEISGYQTSQKQTKNSIFTALEYQIAKQMTINTLFRQALFDGKMMPFIPSLGFNYTRQGAKKEFELKANLARNFRNPTLNDLYWFPVGNPDLRPEKGWNAEVGVGIGDLKSTKKMHFGTEITFFATKIKDWILWSPAIAGYWRPENLKTVRTQGLEWSFDLDKKGAKWQIHFTSLYSFTQSLNLKTFKEADNSKNKQLIYIPKHSHKSSLKIAKKSFHLLFEEEYFSRRYTSTDNNYYLPYYILFNISFGKSFKIQEQQVLFQFKTKNITHFQYQSIANYPMSGRTWEVSLSFLLNKTSPKI